MKRNKFLQGPILPIAAVALLALSVVGSTRAAFTTTSNDFTAQLETAALSVAVLENGSAVSGDGALLKDLVKDGESFQIGKRYEEKISVSNDGTEYEEYVRAIITKSWRDGEDNSKNTYLDPDLIELTIADGWIEDENASTKEQAVYYYTKPLAQGETIDLVTALRVAGTIETTYDYDGTSFSIDAEVDAVQTHSAEAAILGAWGVDVSIDSDGNLTSINTAKGGAGK
jgi:hypothetical protein